MYPLKNYEKLWRSYRHGDKTFYSNFHLGEDIITPINTPIVAPFNCIVEKKIGKQGGNMAYCTIKKGTKSFVIRFLHCNAVYAGKHKKGATIALSGNTGLSTSPHIHLDISPTPLDLNKPKRFIDPSKFEWLEKGEYMYDLKRLKDLVRKYYDRAKLYAMELNKVRGLYKKSLDEIKKLKGEK